MIFFFVSLLMLIFKWYRFIFVLISLEFLMMSVFVKFFEVFNSMVFFFFMCHSVISSILGVVIMVGGVKFYGSDLSIF
nr:NADH dehydrogenase subunit 4L [Angiostrongylus cantonensis]WKT13335.1 NADH dehydrogenase subunit 4L [Angiostrongylus cantonensis]WKT13347.1 NADH dehydrogenase subunit 4L [Angiostrongylus cantonensis]